MADKNYEVNPNDPRFVMVNNEERVAKSEVNKTYDGMIANSDKYYNTQVNAAKEWEKTQTKLQNEKTDFAIEEINQQKEQAKQDYTKEQSGAYVDWQKQSNAYGANAEQMAAQGMANTGFSESSQVAMYNQYQNRVATARQSYDRAVLNYNNAITEARLQNSSILAEIAYESLQTQLKLSLEGFQYKNTLITEKAKTLREIDNEYDTRWQDVLKQINTENAMKMEQDQFDANMKWQKEQFDRLHPVATGDNVIKKKGGVNITGQSTKEVDRIILDDKKYANGKKTTSSLGKSEPEIDMQSVFKLGYGRISEKRLAELVEKGEVEMYTQNGKTKFRRVKGVFKGIDD